MPSCSQLIITSAYGWRYQVPRAFLVSARNSGLQCPIWIIRHARDPRFLQECRNYYSNTHAVYPIWYPPLMVLCKIVPRLGTLGSWLVKIPACLAASSYSARSFQQRAKYLLHMSSSRYLIALDMLESQPHQNTQQVLLSDSRDVVFQRNPFNELQDTLITGEEPAKLQDEAWNRRWLEHVYGDEPDLLQSLYPCPILCSGVTMGRRDVMVDYLKKMSAELQRKLPSVSYRPGVDQIIHNKILHESSPQSVHPSRNGSPVIATLATDDLASFHPNHEQGLLTKAQQSVCIVHQYDRHPRLQSLIPV